MILDLLRRQKESDVFLCILIMNLTISSDGTLGALPNCGNSELIYIQVYTLQAY